MSFTIDKDRAEMLEVEPLSQKEANKPEKAYFQALKLYPIAKALITLAQQDAPNYKPATGVNRCANCLHFDGQACDLFSFAADPDYICDDWAAQNPEIGEIRALMEKAGARHSQGDNRMLQEIHDAAVKLGAVCESNEDDN